MHAQPSRARHALQDNFLSLSHSFSNADHLLDDRRDALTRHEELFGVFWLPCSLCEVMHKLSC
jgi:hypothetical protein